MKIRFDEHKEVFRPLSVNLTFETQGEVEAFQAVINRSGSDICNHGKETLGLDIDHYDLDWIQPAFETCEAHLNKFKLKSK